MRSLSLLFLFLAACGDRFENATSPDAASPADSGTTPADGASPADGGAETAPPPTTWCTGKQVAFCSDFDAFASPGERWSGTVEKGGGTLQLDSAIAKSPPRSLKAALPAAAGAPFAVSAHLSRALPLAGKRKVRLSFEVLIKDLPPLVNDAQQQYLALNVNGFGGVALLRTATGWLVYNAATSGSHPATRQLALGDWRSVVLEIDWANGSEGKIRMTVGQDEVLSVTGVKTTTETALQTTELTLGLDAPTGNAPAAAVSYDNVTLEIL